jgi:hypothetical protein
MEREQMKTYFIRIKQSYLDKIGNSKGTKYVNIDNSSDMSVDQLKKIMDVYDKIMKEFD